MAFVGLPGALPRLTAPRVNARESRVTCALAPPEPVSRRALLAGMAALAGLGGVAGSAQAEAGVGLERAVSKFFFPKEGFNAPNAPLGGTIDRSVLETPAGKAALSTLKGYQAKAEELYAEFKADPQTVLNPKVREAFQISELRDALNTFDEAFDEEAQKETDKVVRGIIQDIGELQTAAALRDGAKRTQKKIERTQDWFEKLVLDFKTLLSLYG